MAVPKLTQPACPLHKASFHHGKKWLRSLLRFFITGNIYAKMMWIYTSGWGGTGSAGAKDFGCG
jgi:hypothetical protein